MQSLKKPIIKRSRFLSIVKKESKIMRNSSSSEDKRPIMKKSLSLGLTS
jgi:hypothetical protein